MIDELTFQEICEELCLNDAEKQATRILIEIN